MPLLAASLATEIAVALLLRFGCDRAHFLEGCPTTATKAKLFR